MKELNCIGCGVPGCEGKVGCEWYDSMQERKKVQEIRANYLELSPNDYKCPYCGETTQRGTFHASCYAAN